MSRCVVTALLLAGCSGSHTADDGGAPHSAFMSNDCAPDDGRALRIVISDAIDGCTADPSEPSIELYVFSGVDSVFPIDAGDTITSDSSTTFGNGTATQCPGGTPPCVTSQDWSLTFDTYEDGVSASGSYTIDFDGESARGSFDATFCSFTPPVCG